MGQTQQSATEQLRPGRAPDPAALERAREASDVLDRAIEIPGLGIRIGIDPILGILPVAGDTVSLVASLYVVIEGIRAGAPAWLVAVMLTLVGIDYVVGSIPLVGTLFDAVWKANSWNVRLVERYASV
jgi:hypothetical protein